MRPIFAVLALVLLPGPALSGNVDPYLQQRQMSFRLMQDGISIKEGTVLVSPEGGVISAGTSHYHPRMSCINGLLEVDSIPVFSGLELSYRVAGNALEVGVAKYVVDLPGGMDASLASGECDNLGPRQRVEFLRTLQLPADVGSEEKIIDFGGGYRFGYRTFSPIR